MTLEQYKIRNAENRTHMEKPMEPFSFSAVLGHKERPYLPGAEKNSMKPLPPPGDATADYSSLNGRSWRTSQKNGARLGRPKKKAKR